MKLVMVLSFCFLLFLHVFGMRYSQKKCYDYRRMRTPKTKEFNESHEDAAPKEFPFMARIEDDTHYCNGILISESFVLSTATCGFTCNDSIILGDIQENSYKDDANVQRFDVIEKFVHPISNILLLQLNESVQFNEYIVPACLSQSESVIEQHFLQIGWSSTNIRDNGLVHKVKMNYVDNSLCKETLNSNNRKKYIRAMDNQNIFCAQTKRGDRTMCEGCSGAALLSNDHDADDDEIVGITDVAFGCENSNPAIFIRVSAYIDWIENIVWADATRTRG